MWLNERRGTSKVRSGVWRALLGLSVTTALLLAGQAPAADAAYFNEKIWYATLGPANTLTDCGDDYKANRAILVTEDEVGFAAAREVGTDEGIHFFADEWRRKPGEVQDQIATLKAKVKTLKGDIYNLPGQEYCLWMKQTYSVPNINNAVPVALRAVVSHYAGIGVVNGEVIVTPRSDRVSVLSRALKNGKPAVTIQVTDPVTGATYEYTSQYPEIQRPVDNGPAPAYAFTKVYAPIVSGTAKVGKTLTATLGKGKDWKPWPDSFTYQWYRNGVAISGATKVLHAADIKNLATAKVTYRLVAADKGKRITVKVTGAATGMAATTRTSGTTSTVKAGTLAKGTVGISGTRRVGKTLTATTSRWSSGVTYRYQWYRDGRKIAAATARTYTLTPADKGKRLKVKVVAGKAGYTTTSRTSKETGRIKA